MFIKKESFLSGKVWLLPGSPSCLFLMGGVMNLLSSQHIEKPTLQLNFVWNRLLQISQQYFLTSEWTSRCFFKLTCWLKASWQISH